MNTIQKTLRFFILPGVILLQLIMTQVVTFIFSFLMPNAEDFPQTHSTIFVILLGISFSIGVFAAGWLALNRGWLAFKHSYLARFAAALLGAYVPLISALAIHRTLEPGNPFFVVSILASITGFYLPGLFDRK